MPFRDPTSNPRGDEIEAVAAPAGRSHACGFGVRWCRCRNTAVAVGHADAIRRYGAGCATGCIMTRTLSFIAISFIAILALAATSAAPLCAQENARENTQGTAQEPLQDNARETPAPPAQPQSQVQPQQPPEFADPRFAFHRIENGFLRLDLRTGAVASCSPQADGWACVPGRDERAALDGEIARLRRDNAALKNALLARGVPVPNDMKVDAPPVPAAPAPAESVPRPPQSVPPVPAPPKSTEPDRASRDDAEIERALMVMEKIWRRLVEMMMNIQRDMQKKG